MRGMLEINSISKDASDSLWESGGEEAVGWKERAAFDPSTWFVQPTEHERVDKWACPGGCDGRISSPAASPS